jgi:hypothetical protein
MKTTIYSWSFFIKVCTLSAVTSNKLYLIFLGATTLFSVRLTLFRLRDRETANTNRR